MARGAAPAAGDPATGPTARRAAPTTATRERKLERDRRCPMSLPDADPECQEPIIRKVS
jgi:hypothetical protein